jgi:hypothetical protein
MVIDGSEFKKDEEGAQGSSLQPLLTFCEPVL